MSDKLKSRDKRSKAASLPVQDLKLYAVLEGLNVYELNRFRKFIESPYFNRNETLCQLFDTIEPALRAEDEIVMLRGDIWSTITSNKPYKDQKFRKLCSDLLRLIERFLAQEAFEENSLHRADYLLQAVNRKKLEPLYKSSIRTAQRLSDQYYFRPASYYYHQYAFQREIYSLSGLEIERSKVANTEEIAENLDRFYLAEKLRLYCDILSRRLMMSHEYDLLFMEEIIEHVRQGGYQDEIPINFYYQIYLTHKEPDNHDHYLKLKTLINEHILQLPEVEAKQVMDAALNYSITKINQGYSEFTREIFELFLESLHKELIYINGFITPWTFRNIVVSGLRMGEFEWVEKFIEQYKSRLESKFRDNAVSFNLANLYFYQKDYDRVIQQLQEVEYDDPSYNLNSKTILIATYYELDEIEPLLSLLSSFATYLRRNKRITEERKGIYMQLIRFMRQLVKVPPRDTVALRKLREKIESTSGVVNKDWLLEKITELGG